jgi:hypothetical protein
MNEQDNRTFEIWASELTNEKLDNLGLHELMREAWQAACEYKQAEIDALDSHRKKSGEGMSKLDEKIIQTLRDMVELQGRDGNWNCDEYMHGMYTGMEFMLSIVESREPIYKSRPEKWLSEEPRNYILVSGDAR